MIFFKRKNFDKKGFFWIIFFFDKITSSIKQKFGKKIYQ